jgi:DNA-binding CsgD family transcriptional regulator
VQGVKFLGQLAHFGRFLSSVQGINAPRFSQLEGVLPNAANVRTARGLFTLQKQFTLIFIVINALVTKIPLFQRAVLTKDFWTSVMIPPHASAYCAEPALPVWVPQQARRYLEHTSRGIALREVARRDGCHPSTVLRQIRKLESRRDDPLIDDALEMLARLFTPFSDQKETSSMTSMPAPSTMLDDDTIAREARRILRRLSETDAVLVVSHEMDRAVVLRQPDDGVPTRTAVLPRAVAQAFALKDWISCFAAGKVTRYRITDAGRAALKRLLAEDHKRKVEARGMVESPSPFLTQHVEWGERDVPGEDRKIRVNLAESPLGSLARKKDKGGKPFLNMDLVMAGERLREDFEAAQMGPRVGQNWDRFLTAGDRGNFGVDRGPATGPADARNRVSAALRALGPGLGDVVLRVCCFLEGLEAAEKRMGWSARSGKIVLRIALQRLEQHYKSLHG